MRIGPLSALVTLVWTVGPEFVRADEFFEKQVRPLLVEHCLSCHGPEKQKAGLRRAWKAGWQTGGESGAAIVPGDPDKSLIIKAVRGTDGVKRMPPKAALADRDIATLTKWVKDGAIDPRDGPPRIGGVTLEE